MGGGGKSLPPSSARRRRANGADHQIEGLPVIKINAINGHLIKVNNLDKAWTGFAILTHPVRAYSRQLWLAATNY
jgi:hypothetical protein